MRSVYPFNIGRFRHSNAHGGRIGCMRHHTARPVSLADRPTDFRHMPRLLSTEEVDAFFARELAADDEEADHE
jgi:hypothetical protein